MYTVVLADDEPYILQGLEKRLDWGRLGFEIVGKAGNGLECLELVQRLHPDVLITDIRMPGLNGLKLLEKMRELHRQPVVVYISGYSEFEYARRALDLGALSYLLKPIGQKDLQNVLLKARRAVEKVREERRTWEAKAASELLEFLSALPPGIDQQVVQDRLGFSGRQAALTCFVTGREVEPRVVSRSLGGLADDTCLPIGQRLVLHVLCFSAGQAGSVIRRLHRIPELAGQAGGISAISDDVREIPELIRQAKVACFQGFISGDRSVVQYDPGTGSTLDEMIRDFESLFSVRNMEVIHRLLDQAFERQPGRRLSIEQVLEFYNAFIGLAKKYAPAEKSNRSSLAVIPECYQLAESFADVQQMVDHLHAAVQELYGSGRTGSGAPGSAAGIVAALKQYIRNNLDADLTPAGLAENFQVEKSDLGAIFKAETGRALKEYVRETRMEHVCFLLKHTRLSVQEISELCGFGDYFYFARLFHRQKGMTASDFRKSLGGQLPAGGV